MSAAPEPKDFTPPLRFPFLIGVYMATNAIPDAYTVVDGPDCLFFKSEFIHGKHDLQSTLLDVFGRHRIAVSGVNAGNVVKSKGEAVRRRVRKIDEQPDSAVIFLSSLPMVTIIGTQYDAIIRELQPSTTARLIECPNRSLQGDWLDGYSDMLSALAGRIDTTGAAPDPRKVAVIGYLMDRNEEDHKANVRELERLTAALDLELCSVWLGGQGFAQLGEAKNAGTLLALPLGRKAARTLAQRTGAKVLDVETPFGLARTRRLLVRLGKAAGRLERAEAFIEAQLETWVPRMEWVVPHVFLGKKLGFSGTPDLWGGFVDIAAELGARVVHLSASCSVSHRSESLEEYEGLPPVLFEPKRSAIKEECARLRRTGIDLLVADGEFAPKLNGLFPRHLEFGFPSNRSHALFERPFLGFSGWACFVDRLAAALSAPAPRWEGGRSSEPARIAVEG